MEFFLCLAFCFFLVYCASSQYTNSKKNLSDNIDVLRKIKIVQESIENNKTIINSELEAMKKLETFKFKDTPLVAKLFSDYRAGLLKEHLTSSTKKHPHKEVLKSLVALNKDHVEKFKDYEYTILKYETLFPWIKNYKDTDISILTQDFYMKNDLPNLIDIRSWLFSEELSRLEPIKKDLLEKEKDLIKREKIYNTKVSEIPVFSSILADQALIKDYISAEHLRIKKNPALRASEEIKKIAKQKRDIIQQLKTFEYKIKYYETLFPWLPELEDEPLDITTPTSISNDYNNEDQACNWLTKNEYDSLPDSEKYQKALDRYFKRNKTKWEIGRDYERYIGYLYEQKGFNVQYRGIIDGLEDLGRDLICTKGNITHVVQCKCWSSKKLIHEKHINQLLGTTVMYYLSKINKNGNISDFYKLLKTKQLLPVFVTSTNYSDTATLFASSLGVELRDNIKLESYPMIKCNINKSTKEKIYHLPFDQQYDKVVIDSDGEFYAMKIIDAESKGFRRAFRWKGN